jgi:hypothetical protein
MRCAALNTEPECHLLDHIAPLADLMQMPLIVTDHRNYELASHYYPQVELRYMPDLNFQLDLIAEQFDMLFECKYWVPHLKSLFRDLYNKDMKLVFCPHGQSDKGFQAPLLAPYATQDRVLVYGDLLIEMLKKLDIWPEISNCTIIGNYRLQFYQKHQFFYDQLIAKEVPLNKSKKTLLYAPTWKDADSSTSFFNCASALFAQLPEDWNLIVKLHPLLEKRNPAYFYSIAAVAEKRENLFLIHELPPVYPLLSIADIYLGDFSSVGYDFLFFQRPLYFFPTEHPGRLYSCGQMLDMEKNIYSQLKTSHLFHKQQQDLYRFAFTDRSLSPEEFLRELNQKTK